MIVEHLFLFNYISVAVFGGILAASFCGALDTRKHRIVLAVTMIPILLVQGFGYWLKPKAENYSKIRCFIVFRP